MSQKILALSGYKQAGKNTCANFLVGQEMMALNLIEYFSINNEGKLVVPAMMDDGSVEDGIFDLERRDEKFVYYLVENVWPYMKIYSFADPLKEFCINVLGLTHEQCYGTNEQKNALTHLKWENMPGVIMVECIEEEWGNILCDWLPEKKDYESGEVNKAISRINLLCHESASMTVREVLQFFGTDVCRRMYDNVWADACVRKIEREESEFAIVADCRFPNEVEAVQNAGGKVIRLTRHISEDAHESELILDKENFDWDKFDLIIDNKNLTIMESTAKLCEALKDWEWVSDGS